MNSDIVLQQPDNEEYKIKGSEMVKAAEELTITNQDEYDHAGSWLVEIKGLFKAVWQKFDDPVKKALAAHRAMVALREEATKPFSETELIVKNKMAWYNDQIERKRAAEREKADAKARQEAEEARKLAILEAKRLGDREAAENLKQAPLRVAAEPPKTPEVAKVAGVSFRKVWKVQSVDVDQLPKRYLVADMKGIEATVRGLGDRHGIPGVVVIEETITSVRGGI